LAGVILCEADGRLSEPDRANLEHLRGELGSRLVGEIGWLEPGQSPDKDGIAIDALLDPRGAQSRD
jgi:hypothetical protein